MPVPVFIGNEVDAAGYRLAGLRVEIPPAADLAESVQAACDQAPLVLLGADIAAQLPPRMLDQLLTGITPPVVIVPDVRGQARIPDLATRLRAELGILE
jgi:vacuolar-type H+-ATPase subunit F/Vma7